MPLNYKDDLEFSGDQRYQTTVQPSLDNEQEIKSNIKVPDAVGDSTAYEVNNYYYYSLFQYLFNYLGT